MIKAKVNKAQNIELILLPEFNFVIFIEIDVCLIDKPLTLVEG